MHRVLITENKQRPKLNARQQVAAMKAGGVQFALSNENEVELYLQDKTFYFKLKAFAKLFDKYTNPAVPDYGKYISLDFAYLVELSRLDRLLRVFIMQSSLDIEHYLKVHLNKMLMLDDSIDGYELVSDFLAFNAARKAEEIAKKNDTETLVRGIRRAIEAMTAFIDRANTSDNLTINQEIVTLLDNARNNLDEALGGIDLHHVEKSIARLASSYYSRELAEKYGGLGEMAYWNYFELAAFGDIIALYKYYCFDVSSTDNLVAKRIKQLLFPTKVLRNAAAHNSCLLNQLRNRMNKPVGKIAEFLKNDYEIDKRVVDETRRIPIVHDFSALLITLDTIVQGSSRTNSSNLLKDLGNRLIKNRTYFEKQREILVGLDTLSLLCDVFSKRLIA